jgi:DNA polymerase-3 subunit gamma/tau
VAYCGSVIGVDQARDVLGLTGDEPLRELAELVFAGNLSGGLQLVNGLAESGADLRRFTETFVGYLRGIMLLKSGADAASLTADLSADSVAAWRAATERVAMEQVVKLIRVFSEAELSPRGEVIPQLGLELAVVEAILLLAGGQRPDQSVVRDAPVTERPIRQAGALPPVERVPVTRSEKALPPPSEVKHRTAEAPPSASQGVVPELKTSARAESTKSGEGGVAPPKLETRPSAASISPEAAFAQLAQRWSEVVAAVGPKNRLLQAALRSCRPHELRHGQAIIGCDFPFHRERLSEVQNQVLLQQVIVDIVGTSLPLQLEVVARDKRGRAPSLVTDPLVKEVLSWGGRIKAVIPGSETGIPESESTDQPAMTGQEVNHEH